MGGEMFNAAILSFGLIFIGWAIGTLLLKIQGAEPEYNYFIILEKRFNHWLETLKAVSAIIFCYSNRLRCIFA